MNQSSSEMKPVPEAEAEPVKDQAEPASPSVPDGQEPVQLEE